jgi:hypothetical protein
MTAVLLSLLLAVATPQEVPANLSDVVVRGKRLTQLVSVSVAGDVPVEVLVRSDPVGVRCGVTRFRYDRFAAPRLCWIKRPEGEEIRLEVEGMERLGVGWVAEWEGCEPQAASMQCTLLVPPAGASVSVRIRRV